MKWPAFGVDVCRVFGQPLPDRCHIADGGGGVDAVTGNCRVLFQQFGGLLEFSGSALFISVVQAHQVEELIGQLLGRQFACGLACFDMALQACPTGKAVFAGNDELRLLKFDFCGIAEIRTNAHQRFLVACIGGLQ